MIIVRNLFILFFLIWSVWAIGQTDAIQVDWSDKYQKELKQIDKSEEQGQNRSAYKKAEELFDKAVNDHNIPGIIGSLNRLIRNIYKVDDDAMKTVLVKVGTSIPEHPIVSSVIDSYLAELLTQYYERNRYKISQWNEAESLSWDEIEGWSSHQIENMIDNLYSRSVRPDVLKEVSSESIKSLLGQDPDKIYFELRPRLYDLLQERYVNFLQNKRLHWYIHDEIPDAFTVKQLTSQDLIGYLNSQDEADKIYPIILAYDKWERSLRSSNRGVAYIDIMLQRINFVSNFLGEKYLPASISLLKSLSKEYAVVRNRLAIDHAHASYLYRQGSYAEAREILKTALENKPDHAYENSIDQVQQLIRTIEAPELNLQVEEAYPSGQYPLYSIYFRNLSQVSLELYPLKEDEFIRLRFSESRRKKSGNDLTRNIKPIWRKTIELPESHDYKSHRTETWINSKLDKGAYALRYWYKKDSLNISGIVLFQITDLTLIEVSDSHSKMLDVVNRRTGDKVNEARVESITVVRYPKFEIIENGTLPQDKTGSFVPPHKQLNQYYKISYRSDQYISPITYNSFVNHSPDQPYQRTVLLTDRAVYKPGQTIHFKALTVLSRKLDSELVKNQKIDLSLRNANGKEVWQKTYQTDEWGTVTGTALIPMASLKGSWSLQASPSGQTRIQVEDYQRPNFEVAVFDSSIVRQDSLISLSGEAKTYHGFPIQNGKGEIRVELQRRYWFYGVGPENAEVIHASTFQTNEKGFFETTFLSVDPPASENRYGAFYFYSIQISVQAPSGEIREITKTIPLDPNKKQVQIEYPTFQILNDLSPVKFMVKNALQEPDSQRVKIRVSRLCEPDSYKVDRVWAIPDQPLLTSAQFGKRIDHLFYNHQSSMDEWEEHKLLKSWSQILQDSDTLDLNNLLNKPGYYRIMVTSMVGDTLSTSSFGIGDEKRNYPIVHDAIEILADSQTAQPGESVRLDIYTPEKTKGGKMIISYPDGSSDKYDLSKEKVIVLKVREKDRGGIHIRAFGYLSNRFYEKSLIIDVPWVNKELNISGLEDLSTLEVSSDNSLNIRVVNNNSVGVSSEVSVAIYDASLDAYLPHDWNVNKSFFRSFSDPLSVKSLAATLGDNLISENNYWNQRILIHSLLRPELPYLEFGYGRLMYARSKMIGVDQAPPVAMELMADNGVAMTEQESENIDNTASQKSVPTRKDFSETLLFYGKAMTDSTGHVLIPFHTNDKAGRWKILVFAHTQDLSSGVISHTFETNQDILLESYLPGIVRQGDEMVLNFTLYNTSDKTVSGQVQFEMKQLYADKTSVSYKKYLGFDLAVGESAILSLPVQIELDENGPLIFLTRVVDDAGKIWDTTEEVVPVLPATEIVFDGKVEVVNEGEIWSGNEVEGLLEDGDGNVTIRIVQNMYTELMKSLPYLQSSNPVTTDQFFRNGVQAFLGQYIAEQIPDFERIYQEWKRKGELESRLAQNKDKKYVSLDNTPWVRQNDSGTEQMALLSLFFDKSYMNQVIESNMTKWALSQNPDGGFPWIKDGPSSFYITVGFLTQWNKLKWAGVGANYFGGDQLLKAQEYVNVEFLNLWKKMKGNSTDSTVYYQRFIPYFTARALNPVSAETSEDYLSAWNELKDSIYANWSDYSTGLRVEIGKAAWYLGDKKLSREIVEAIKDNAIRNPELGVYWRYNHQSHQDGYLGVLSGITELLILNDDSSLNNGITQWVLVNKMTNDWQQNPSVTSLMLSLLKMNGDWTTSSSTIVTRNGSQEKLNGIGDVYSVTLNAEELKTFRVEHREGPPIWMGIITRREVLPDDVSIQTGDILHIQKMSVPVESKDAITIGNQLTIRLKLSTDRDLDYVYIEDPLVPGMDPGINLSGYERQYGLFFYQSFDPSSARFYIQHLPKGEYILEYKLGAVRTGTFIHPRTKIQSYFVPEITGFDRWKPKVVISNQ